MKRAAAFFGIAGLFLAGVGMVDFLMESRLTLLGKIHFLIAGAGILFYIATHVADLVRTLRSRTAQYGALVSIYALVVLAILAGVNALGALTSTQLADLTESGLYTLSPMTRQFLGGLDDNLTIHAFFNNGKAGLEAVRPVDRLLRTLVSASRKVKLDVINPLTDPASAEKYKVTHDATLILEYKNQTQKVNTITEESMTNAIIRLLDNRQKVACFTTGHGEPALSGDAGAQILGQGNLKELLTRKDYQVREVGMKSQTEVPPDCTIVLIAGPTTAFTYGELSQLDQYLRQGGRVFAAIDAGSQSGLQPLLTRWGVQLGENIVVEKEVMGVVGELGVFQPTVAKPSMFLTVSDYDKTYPITLDLSHVRPTQYFAARTVEASNTTTAEVKVVPLMWSKKDSWIETGVTDALTTGLAILEPPKGDRPGPATLAVAVSLQTQSASEPLRGYSRQARMVVVGDAAWLTNRLFRESMNFNSDLMLNMAGWLAGFEQYMRIGTKSTPAKSLVLRRDQSQAFFNVTVIFIPELLLLLGAFVWWIRR